MDTFEDVACSIPWQQNTCSNKNKTFKRNSLWITGFGFPPSHPHPCGSGREPCMSTDLGFLTKAQLNLFCHIPFTPWNGSRTVYQSSWVTARCPSRLVSCVRFSPLNVPPLWLQQDWGSVWHYLTQKPALCSHVTKWHLVNCETYLSHGRNSVFSRSR